MDTDEVDEWEVQETDDKWDKYHYLLSTLIHHKFCLPIRELAGIVVDYIIRPMKLEIEDECKRFLHHVRSKIGTEAPFWLTHQEYVSEVLGIEMEFCMNREDCWESTYVLGVISNTKPSEKQLIPFPHNKKGNKDYEIGTTLCFTCKPLGRCRLFRPYSKLPLDDGDFSIGDYCTFNHNCKICDKPICEHSKQKHKMCDECYDSVFFGRAVKSVMFSSSRPRTLKQMYMYLDKIYCPIHANIPCFCSL